MASDAQEEDEQGACFWVTEFELFRTLTKRASSNEV
jgi:hypothetical protein